MGAAGADGEFSAAGDPGDQYDSGWVGAGGAVLWVRGGGG